MHELADYGTTVESELEVFAFIARANDDMSAFSLLAMVVSLFETGYLATGASSIDYRRLDWFALAPLPIDDVRARFGVTPKSADAGAVGPRDPGGISPCQHATGRRVAEALGRSYDSFGASPEQPSPSVLLDGFSWPFVAFARWSAACSAGWRW